MNIFVLSDSPVVSAQLQHDKHVVKMTLETAQLVSCAVRYRKDWRDALGDEVEGCTYRVTHHNHPCAKWARASINNLEWLCAHGVALADEYSIRFGRTHRSLKVIQYVQSIIRVLPECSVGLTPFAQALPDIYKDDDAIVAYRLYYVSQKIKDDSKWAYRRQFLPLWLLERALS